ncbi:MAG: protein kinase [bacterium]|nr:protein kinase [bacterium]
MYRPDLHPNASIGDFMIAAQLAEGPQTIMYRAHQQSVDRDVALKLLLHDDREPLVDFHERFLQEARLLAALEHLHIVPTYSYGTFASAAMHGGYIAMRLMRGGSLDDYLKSQGHSPLSLRTTDRLFEQIADALDYAHQRGVFHRHLKPANILLDEHANAYISDFGLAEIRAPFTRTPYAMIPETPLYMAPEQIQGLQADARTDIYSLGALLYHMLTGHAPHETAAAQVIPALYAKLNDAPARPRTWNPAIPPALEALILRALSRDPADRFASVGAMIEAYRQARPEAQPLSQPRLRRKAYSQPETEAETDFFPSRRALWAIGAATGLLAAVFIGLSFWSGVEQRRILPPIAAPIPELTRAADALRLTESEIAAAQQRVGESGFIAYIACTLQSETQAVRVREMTEHAARYTIPVRAYDSQASEYRHIAQIERAHAEGAAAVVLCPVSAYAGEAIAAALDAQIPVILLGLAPRFAGAAYVGTDAYQLGYAAAAFAGAWMRRTYGERASVAVLGFETFTPFSLRMNGLRDGLRDHAPEANLIGVYSGSTREEAENVTRRLIETDYLPNVMLCYADVCAYGVIQALEAAGIPPDAVDVISINAETLAVSYIEQGLYLRASQAINREATSHAAVDAAIKQLGGGTIPETILIPPGEMITR